MHKIGIPATEFEFYFNGYIADGFRQYFVENKLFYIMTTEPQFIPAELLKIGEVFNILIKLLVRYERNPEWLPSQDWGEQCWSVFREVHQIADTVEVHIASSDIWNNVLLEEYEHDTKS